MTAKKILVAPLDWGLGHSTRCVSLILKFQEEGHEVVLAATGLGAAFLKLRFPELQMLTDIPSYNITYPSNGKMVWHFMKQSRRLAAVIREEHAWLQKNIQQFHFTEVYSDNRYGLYTNSIPCHLITHQIFVRVPFVFRWIVKRRIFSYIKKFTTCIVPDFGATQNLSGALSHGRKIPSNVKYIGPISRFDQLKGQLEDSEKRYSFVAIISGPEPQRTMLFDKIEEILISIDRPSLIVCGQPNLNVDETIGNLRIVSHLTDEALAGALLQCKTVIARSGYSTLMDLHSLKKMAVIIPTPGQTEQEYLAEYHHRAGRHVRIRQNELSKEKIIQAHHRIAYK